GRNRQHWRFAVVHQAVAVGVVPDEVPGGVPGARLAGVGEREGDRVAGDAVIAAGAPADQRVEGGVGRVRRDGRVVQANGVGQHVDVDLVAVQVDLQVVGAVGGVALDFEAVRDADADGRRVGRPGEDAAAAGHPARGERGRLVLEIDVGGHDAAGHDHVVAE